MGQSKIKIEQLPDESMQDFIKLVVFLELGSTRTLSQAYEKYYEYKSAHAVSKPWQALAEKNRWEARISEYEKIELNNKPAPALVAPKHKK